MVNEIHKRSPVPIYLYESMIVHEQVGLWAYSVHVQCSDNFMLSSLKLLAKMQGMERFSFVVLLLIVVVLFAMQLQASSVASVASMSHNEWLAMAIWQSWQSLRRIALDQWELGRKLKERRIQRTISPSPEPALTPIPSHDTDQHCHCHCCNTWSK